MAGFFLELLMDRTFYQKVILSISPLRWYEGKCVHIPGQGLNYTLVMDCMAFPLIGRRYSLFIDNLYFSPAFFEELSRQNTGACGTIRKKQIGFPKTKQNDLTEKCRKGRYVVDMTKGLYNGWTHVK